MKQSQIQNVSIDHITLNRIPEHIHHFYDLRFILETVFCLFFIWRITMAVTVETLDKLERKIILSLPTEWVQSEVTDRLKKLSKTIKLNGFRPGKIPMSFMEQRYGFAVRQDVLGDKVGESFALAVKDAQLQVVGQPRIQKIEAVSDGEFLFEAIFEVMPDITIGDLTAVEIEKTTTQVTDSAIDKTIELLRKQCCTFSQRPLESAAQVGDRITADYEGKINGESFPGGKAVDFQFILGEGQMLQAFEDATLGMKVSESKTFPLTFPANYHPADVANKSADFMLTIKKIEVAHLPEVTSKWIQSLDTNEVSVEGFRENIRKNVEREVNVRLLARNKTAAINALMSISKLDVPKVTVQEQMGHLLEQVRTESKNRGIKNADQTTVKEDELWQQAQYRVRLNLVVHAFIHTYKLEAQQDQIRAYVEELAASYVKSDEFIQAYLGDKKSMEEATLHVLEKNITEYIFSKAKVIEKELTFEDLMK
jgi:trigger factor